MDNRINKEKTIWKPGTLLAPVPPVMVTCKHGTNRPNIITIAWAGTICSEPPMLSISVRPERYSYNLIKDSGEFCVNIPDRKLAEATDLCGVISGKKFDKFHETGLTIAKAQKLETPIILECPLNLECKITQEIELGSHNMFLAEIVAVQVSKDLIDKDNHLNLNKTGLLGYAHGHYYQLGKTLGSFGFSVKKKK